VRVTGHSTHCERLCARGRAPEANGVRHPEQHRAAMLHREQGDAARDRERQGNGSAARE